MEDKKLTAPSSEELNEEDLLMVFGGTGNDKAIPNLARPAPDLLTCDVCGKLMSVNMLHFTNNRKFCHACMTGQK